MTGKAIEMSNAEPALVIEDLTVAYRDSPALWDVDVTVPTGKLAAITANTPTGPSRRRYTLALAISNAIAALAPSAFTPSDTPGPSGLVSSFFTPRD